MSYRIALIKGDGIGPEVITAAVAVLEKTAAVYGHSFCFEEALAGGCAIDAVGVPLPTRTLDVCKNCDAVLLGAVGGPKWDCLPGNLRPERAILGLRSELIAARRDCGFMFFTKRPELAAASPLRADVAGKGIDLVFVRELTGGIYFAQSGRTSEPVVTAYDTEQYTEPEVERIGRKAFELALLRRKRLVSVDKANVLESSRLWREVMHRLSKSYPEVMYSDMLVDNAAMQLITDPGRFDVIVTSNLFGDILSDEAAALTGSIGLIPSASLGEGSFGLFEPIHGSAPDIAGRGIANPVAAILSSAMLLRHSLSLEQESVHIEQAVKEALLSQGRAGATTKEMTENILYYI